MGRTEIQGDQVLDESITGDDIKDQSVGHSELLLNDGSNPHSTTKADVGLGNADNTSDADKPVSTAQQEALDLKYDASNPNNYETPSQLDARDTANRDRANHTGTQLASTISDFETAHDSLPNDNPHSVTFTQSVAQDSGTDISAAEAETLTDNSNADSLHQHDHGNLQGLGDDDHPQYTRKDTLTTKGDIYARNSTIPTRVGVGSNNQILSADSSTGTGLLWKRQVAQHVDFTVASLIANSPDLTGLTQLQEVVSALANRNFGKGFDVAFTAGNFQTTSGSPQTIQTVTPSVFTNGDYVAFSYGRYLKTLLAGQLETNFLLNGSTEFSQDEVSMDDDDYFYGHTSIAYFPGLTSSPTIEFQIRKSSGGGNVQAENRLLLLWRVA